MYALERMRRLFPHARIVLIRRDPLDVINSILQPNTFWLDCPKTIEHAVSFFKDYQRREHGFQDYDYIVRYEDLWNDPVCQTARLLDALGLDPSGAERIVEQTRLGRNLPAGLSKVFREGTPGQGLKRFNADERATIERMLSEP